MRFYYELFETFYELLCRKVLLWTSLQYFQTVVCSLFGIVAVADKTF